MRISHTSLNEEAFLGAIKQIYLRDDPLPSDQTIYEVVSEWVDDLFQNGHVEEDVIDLFLDGLPPTELLKSVTVHPIFRKRVVYSVNPLNGMTETVGFPLIILEYV